MRPKQGEYYLAHDSDIVRLIYVSSVKKIKKETDEYEYNEKIYEIEGILIAGFTPNEEYFWYQKSDGSQGDIEELEKGNDGQLIELLTPKKFRKLLKQMFRDWK